MSHTKNLNTGMNQSHTISHCFRFTLLCSLKLLSSAALLDYLLVFSLAPLYSSSCVSACIFPWCLVFVCLKLEYSQTAVVLFSLWSKELVLEAPCMPSYSHSTEQTVAWDQSGGQTAASLCEGEKAGVEGLHEGSPDRAWTEKESALWSVSSRFTERLCLYVIYAHIMHRCDDRNAITVTRPQHWRWLGTKVPVLETLIEKMITAH